MSETTSGVEMLLVLMTFWVRINNDNIILTCFIDCHCDQLPITLTSA